MFPVQDSFLKNVDILSLKESKALFLPSNMGGSAEPIYVCTQVPKSSDALFLLPNTAFIAVKSSMFAQ